MPKYLTVDQLRKYCEHGVTFPVRVLTPHQTQHFRRACDELEQAMGGRPRTIELRQVHLHFRWAFELATSPAVLDAVEDALGPDLLIWATELFAKHPHDPAVSIGWHRDAPYMGFDPPHAVTAWISLGASTPANGCMQIVPKSTPERGIAGGRHGQPAMEETAHAGQHVAPTQQAVDVVLAPGEMSLHDPFVLHGSRCNTSGEKRVGFVVRFVAPTARPRHGPPPAVLVRGEDRWGHFELVEPTASRDLSRAIAGLRESAGRHLDAVLKNSRSERRSTGPVDGRPANPLSARSRP